MREDTISVRDRIFGVVAAFSALYCSVVVFALKLPGGQERFFIALAIFILSFSFVQKKAGVALGILAFIALRFIVATIVFLTQRFALQH